MDSHIAIHAELVDYCRRNGVATSSFGLFVLKDSGFAGRLLQGSAPIRRVVAAQRFMAENPEVPPRTFGAVAKAWRERIATEVAGGDAGVAHGCPAGLVGECTDATLDQLSDQHNQQSHSIEGPA